MDPVQTWFQTKAFATKVVKPRTLAELQEVDLAGEYFCIGAGSNTLIRDGGFDGTVIKLSGDFTKIKIEGNLITIGSGCLNRMVVHTCLEHSLSGLEFLIGIPGTIGGAIAMNAGAVGHETKDSFISCEIMLPNKTTHTYTKNALNMIYRHSAIPEGAIILSGTFQLTKKEKLEIETLIHKCLAHRNEAQPIKGRTGGSTFKNPSDTKRAWELIDEVGLRGYRIGDAEFSPKHCNFIMNIGHATAQDIESLGELARTRVREKHGIELEWEIKRLGKTLPNLSKP